MSAYSVITGSVWYSCPRLGQTTLSRSWFYHHTSYHFKHSRTNLSRATPQASSTSTIGIDS